MAGDANGVLMQWRFPSMALEQSISAVGALRCRGALVAPWHGTARHGGIYCREANTTTTRVLVEVQFRAGGPRGCWIAAGDNTEAAAAITYARRPSPYLSLSA